MQNRTNWLLLLLARFEPLRDKRAEKALACISIPVFQIEAINDQNAFLGFPLATKFNDLELLLLRARNLAKQEIFFELVGSLLLIVALVCFPFFVKVLKFVLV